MIVTQRHQRDSNSRARIRTQYGIHLKLHALGFELTTSKYPCSHLKRKRLTKNRQKFFCSKFVEKLIKKILLNFFAKDVLKCLVRGAKTIRKNIKLFSRNLRIYVQKIEKKINPRFWRKFLKNLIFLKFFELFGINILKHVPNG